MKNNKDTTIYPFDKGSGFVVLPEKNAMQKIEEQLGKAKIAENDPTLKFTNKIQKILCRLRKEKKFTDKEYFQIYPSDPIPPRLYGTIKAHKPEKNYPMRTIVSTIGTPAYGISKYLVEIIQPTLNKNNNKIQNSTSFVHKAKDWKIELTESITAQEIKFSIKDFFSKCDQIRRKLKKHLLKKFLTENFIFCVVYLTCSVLVVQYFV